MTKSRAFGRPPSFPPSEGGKKRGQQAETTTLYIKNMVCPRCIRVVKEEFENLGLDVRNVILGEVTASGTVDVKHIGQIKKVLEENGFELIEDQNAKVIEKIKLAVLKLARNDHESSPLRGKDSVFIAKEVGREYHSLSSLFSSVENMTIEHYTILQRIEYVKELLKYRELNLSEISYKLGYSSVAHLSNQFKQVTGMTPSQFKRLGIPHRHSIDHIP
ncbi:MAG TPA: AraC family transcriptional regulator [Bacteroidota bacterium]|nr:AraC family transcriptional regulator [Bacteroidota bacterium]